MDLALPLYNDGTLIRSLECVGNSPMADAGEMVTISEVNWNASQLAEVGWNFSNGENCILYLLWGVTFIPR